MSRRITRRRRRYSRQVIVLLALVALTALWANERFSGVLEFLDPITGAETITGRVTHVRDGDTIEVNRIPVRLADLDCAEHDTAKGKRATRRMRVLVAGQEVTCRLSGRRSYDREVGRCWLEDKRDVADVMIDEGYCDQFR